MTRGHGVPFGNGQSLETSIVFERDLHAGLLQSLKWTMQFASPNGAGAAPDFDSVHEVVQIGQHYEVLVDVLKMAAHDRVAIAVDTTSQLISVYEGGDLTGCDAQLFRHDVRTLPFKAQSALVHDDDQLTARWTAGDFRKMVCHLDGVVKKMKRERVVSTFGGQIQPLFYRPKLVEIEDLPDRCQQAALEDLTLTPEKVEGCGMWGLVAWLDIPFVMVGSRRIGLSNVIETLAGRARDDYMLRTAVRCDSNQYNRVSGLREDRMIDYCEVELNSKGWECHRRYMLQDPPQEIDMYAVRPGKHLVLQLKSTLRPETPWEVLKRNDDLIKGIRHTVEVLNRLRGSGIGFVLTDGYRGDYQTWKESLAHGVLTATLEDIGEIASDPLGATDLVKRGSGFAPNGGPSPLPEREFELFGWKFRLLDSPSPSLAG